jgi:hypothetical protein
MEDQRSGQFPYRSHTFTVPYSSQGRKVVTVDIPGAFMQTDIDELIHVNLEDELVDVLLLVDNKYAEFVTHENGRRVI